MVQINLRKKPVLIGMLIVIVVSFILGNIEYLQSQALSPAGMYIAFYLIGWIFSGLLISHLAKPSSLYDGPMSALTSAFLASFIMVPLYYLIRSFVSFPGPEFINYIGTIPMQTIFSYFPIVVGALLWNYLFFRKKQAPSAVQATSPAAQK